MISLYPRRMTKSHWAQKRRMCSVNSRSISVSEPTAGVPAIASATAINEIYHPGASQQAGICFDTPGHPASGFNGYLIEAIANGLDQRGWSVGFGQEFEARFLGQLGFSQVLGSSRCHGCSGSCWYRVC